MKISQDGLDGVIGLSREYITISKSTGPLLVKQLSRQQNIQKAIFAFRIDETN